MSLTTAAAIYFIIWWLVLFIVLPWGVHSQHESGEIAPGTEPGAPAIPKVRAKLGWTTLVATVLFAIFYVIYTSGVVTLDDLARWMGMPA